MEVVSQTQQLFDGFSFITQATISLGGIAIAIIAIIQLWKMIRPDYELEIKEMKDHFDTEIGKRDIEFEKLESRVSTNEKNISAIDIPFIHKRFDKMEKKIDDLMTMLITHFK